MTKRLFVLIVLALIFIAISELVSLSNANHKQHDSVDGDRSIKTGLMNEGSDRYRSTTIEQNSGQHIEYKIIELAEGGYGYQILVNDKLLINQLSIPCLPGTNGFATKYDALRVVELVTKKIANNEMPPSISIEELEQLNITI